ncbi:uncharacterized protein PAC_16933 [Phialocephala subalpina]|uniref:DUF6590 domain-containing protein n=1 Tax=Phialocephala subalpina TaxID=576137 RepID=A0A1L7XPS4_9HELO|nr:uncharacterized protein PAC_16933 [Phialocephala subalpina]
MLRLDPSADSQHVYRDGEYYTTTEPRGYRSQAEEDQRFYTTQQDANFTEYLQEARVLDNVTSSVNIGPRMATICFRQTVIHTRSMVAPFRAASAGDDIMNLEGTTSHLRASCAKDDIMSLEDTTRSEIRPRVIAHNGAMLLKVKRWKSNRKNRTRCQRPIFKKQECKEIIQYSPNRLTTATPKMRFIKATPVSEELDPSFRIRNKDYKIFFRCGRVFKTLWTDPAGNDAVSSGESGHSVTKFKVAHGQYVYSKIRCFVVVSQQDRSCQCLPITTYEGKGITRRGIRLQEHGLIYSGDEVPSRPQGLLPPVKVKLSRNGERLSSSSYINYGRAYCVDTNVKVKDIGELYLGSRKLLRESYTEIHFGIDEEEPNRYPDANRSFGPNPIGTDYSRGIGAGIASSSNVAMMDSSLKDPTDVSGKQFMRPQKIGRIFKVPWAEPAGSVTDDESPLIISPQNGERIFQKIRRFVVLRQMQDHCLCLPLNTHNRQGASKDRVEVQDYAAVFTAKTPEPDTSEEQLEKLPFPVIVEAPTETVDPMSRINFGRVYTVEYNLRVQMWGELMQIGLISSTSTSSEAFLDDIQIRDSRIQIAQTILRYPMIQLDTLKIWGGDEEKGIGIVEETTGDKILMSKATPPKRKSPAPASRTGPDE